MPPGRLTDLQPQHAVCHPGEVSELDEVRAELAALRADVDELTGLREEVARLRSETADTRALAAMADRDAADVRASLRGIVGTQNALRETQLEQGRSLQEIAGAVGALVVGQQQLVEGQRQLAEGQQRHEEVLAEILRRLPASEA